MVISAILVLLFYMNVVADDTTPPDQQPILDYFLNWSVVLLIASVIFAAVVSPIFTVIHNPKAAVKSLISIGVLGLVILVSYLSADGTLMKFTVETSGNEPSSLILGDTCLYSVYILTVLGIIAVAASEVMKFFK